MDAHGRERPPVFGGGFPFVAHAAERLQIALVPEVAALAGGFPVVDFGCRATAIDAERVAL